MLKSLFIIGLLMYMIASVFVIADYLRTQYGYYGKFLCSFEAKERLRNSVVRIVGGYSEGTVIADEPAPKVIFPDGSFVTVVSMVGDSMSDLAILYIEEEYPDLVFKLPDKINLREDEPVLATGYPMGTQLSGEATTLKGSFIDYRITRGHGPWWWKRVYTKFRREISKKWSILSGIGFIDFTLPIVLL